MLKARIADNPHSQQQGLMFVEELPSDEGMLFVFRRASRLSFWGMNTYIPLDIAFIDDNNRIIKISHIIPHSLRPVYSDKDCKVALEVNRGYFAENNISVGDKVSFKDAPKLSHNVEREFDVTLVVFEKEGQSSNKEKDFSRHLPNLKESQTLPLDKVTKPDQKVVGEPVKEEEGGNAELPVVNTSQLGSILEDSLDQQTDSEQPENSGIPQGNPPEEQQEELPVEPQKQYPTFTSAFQATEWAEKNGEVIRISYTTKHGRSLIRDVEPHGKFHSESSHRMILVTFDETVGDIRAFIVENISKWAFVGKQFSKKFVVKS